MHRESDSDARMGGAAVSQRLDISECPGLARVRFSGESYAGVFFRLHRVSDRAEGVAVPVAWTERSEVQAWHVCVRNI